MACTELSLNAGDIARCRNLGINPQTMAEQWHILQSGQTFAQLIRPAAALDGIVVLQKSEEEELLQFFADDKVLSKLMKFVPASGSATRMFTTLERCSAVESSLSVSEKEEISKFFTGLAGGKFAFTADLKLVMNRNGLSLQQSLAEQNFKAVIPWLLEKKGLALRNLPKALIPFHLYSSGPRTALTEHLYETVQYAGDTAMICRIHFTVAPGQRQAMIEHGQALADLFQRRGTKLEIAFSTQKKKTQTLAADEAYHPMRDKSGRLVLRASGHGALLENLAETGGDPVFIRNIDNVQPEHLRSATVRYQKILTALLRKTQTKIFQWLKRLQSATLAGNELDNIAAQCRQLFLLLPPGFASLASADKQALLFRLLNRPLRVCGMVRNQGEPGGGPFYTRAGDGSVTLQIVESAEVNFSDTAQAAIFHSASHFNPVSMVCSWQDFRGHKFKLGDFVDRSRHLVISKIHEGRPNKLLELPGLWNGAMAGWLTLFIEIPLSTFTPVKTVNDLLRPEHQPGP